MAKGFGPSRQGSKDEVNCWLEKQTLLLKGIAADNNYELVELQSPWKDDSIGIGIVHPEHKNEVLTASNPDLGECWIIFDCYKDVYTFKTFREAFDEFLCPIGHLMWEDAMSSGQIDHIPDNYFKANNSPAPVQTTSDRH